MTDDIIKRLESGEMGRELDAAIELASDPEKYEGWFACNDREGYVFKPNEYSWGHHVARYTESWDAVSALFEAAGDWCDAVREAAHDFEVIKTGNAFRLRRLVLIAALKARPQEE